MKSFVLLPALFLGSLSAFAQQPTTSARVGDGAQENLRSLAKGAQAFTFDDRYEGVRGTPYVSKSWQQGDIELTSNVRITGVPLKYDSYRNQLLAQPDKNKRDSILLNLATVRYFSVQNPLVLDGRRTFRRFDEAPKPAHKEEFVEVLHQNKYQLLKRYGKELLKANYQGAYSQGRPFDELVDKTEYYLRRPNGSVVEVKLNSKSLMNAAPELAPALKTELQNRSLKTEADLQALLQAADRK